MKEFDLLTQTLQPAVSLIEASAGTGKTYNIQHLYLRFIVEEGLTPAQILVVTFSKEATAELKLRVTRNLSQAEEFLLTINGSVKKYNDNKAFDKFLTSILNRALDRFEYNELLRRVQFAVRAMDEAAILTIHGFCLSILTDYAFESGSLFGIELVEEKSSLFEDLINDFIKKNIAYRDDLEGVLLRNYFDVNSLQTIISFVYGKDDVVPVSNPMSLPDIRKLYNTLLFEDFTALRGSLKKKRGTKAYIILDYLESHPDPSDIELVEFIILINGNIVSDIVKKSKYFYTVFHQDFQDIILKFRQIPDIVVANGYKQFFEHLKICYTNLDNSEEKYNLVFDDLLYLTKSAIKSDDKRLVRHVREAYSAVMVDEFQDTSGVQFEIFNTLFGNNTTSFFMIGDPKQSIYAFRGADIFSYLKAVKSDNVKRATLTSNFRSTSGYISAMNKLFENRVSFDNYSLPFIHEEINYITINAGRDNSRRLSGKVDSAPLEIRWYDDGEVLNTEQAENKIVCSVASDIADKLNLSYSGKVYFKENGSNSELKPSDFAILVSTNRQGEMVRHELNKRGIVAVLLKSGNVFESVEAEELVLILKAMVSPKNDSAVMAALSTKCFDYSIVQLAKYKNSESKVLDYWAEFFHELNQVLECDGFLKAFMIFFERTHDTVSHLSPKSVLAVSNNGERAITNYLQIIEKLEQELLIRNEIDLNVFDLLQDLRLNSPDTEENEMRLESDEDAVKIMTIHKSKGLQFSIVYVPFMYSAVRSKAKFTKPVTCHGDDGRIGLILSQSDMNTFSAKLELEERAEKMRLLYVAFTRAVDKCIVYGGKIKSIEKSSLADIFERDFSRLSILSESENISVVYKWETSDAVFRPENKNIELHCKKFNGNIERDWGVMSYSSLVNHDYISHDVRSDITLSNADNENTVAIDIDNLSPLPSSNVVGSAVHEIIEESKFSVNSSEFDLELIYEKLKKYGVISSSSTYASSELEINAVQRTLSLTSSINLTDAYGREFCLSEVSEDKIISEMNFYFPVESKISTERLYNFFNTRGLKGYREQEHFKDIVSKLGISLQNKGFREGFLFGLIDLVFEYKGKFYFADWKTNNLSKYGGYSSISVLASMGESGYLLQFYIYTVALNLFLRSRIPDFDYNKHFGGGYYLYLRGLELANSDRGIFYELPSDNDVEELIDIFTGGVNG